MCQTWRHKCRTCGEAWLCNYPMECVLVVDAQCSWCLGKLMKNDDEFGNGAHIGFYDTEGEAERLAETMKKRLEKESE